MLMNTLTLSDVVARHYDVVVVGGGSAGAVMASRLSEDGDKVVLLVEAGESYLPDAYPQQLALARNVGGDAGSVWPHTSEIGSSKATGGLRAKVLGGGSAINAAGFARAPRFDFDRWTAAGLKGWSYEQVLPYFKKSESADFGEDQWHGRDGPMPVHLRRKSDLTRTARDFIDSALRAGHTFVEDINTPFPKGVGIYPLNIRAAGNAALELKDREVRVNTAMAYLPDRVRHRANLDVLGSTMVDKVLFKAGAARGVRLADGSEVGAAQVVLCAGAIGTAAILLRSGVGPEAQLSRHGIPVIADLPVGKFLMDQPNVYLQVATRGDDAIWPSIGGKVWGQSSMAKQGQIDIYLGFNHFANLAQSPTGKAFGVIACASRPSAHGELQLESGDPLALPRVSLNLLSDEADLKTLVEAVEMTRRVLVQEPLRSRVVSLSFSDGSPVPTERDALEQAIPEHVDSTLHVTSTAPMGPAGDPRAVLDERGRVRGLTGLIVADASVFPDTPSVATNPTVIMAAEYIADMMKHSA